MFLLQAAQPQQGGGYSGLIMIVAIFVIFWLRYVQKSLS